MADPDHDARMTPPGSPQQTRGGMFASPVQRRAVHMSPVIRHSPPVRSPAGRQLASPDENRNQGARRRKGEKPDEELDEVEDANADDFAGGPAPPSAPTAAGAREPASGDAALDLLKREFQRGVDDNDWALNENKWSARPGVQIVPSDTWAVSIRGVHVAVATAFAPQRPCAPNVTPPALRRLEEGRRLRSVKGHEKLFVLAQQLPGNPLEALLGKLPPSKLRSSGFSSSEEDEASAGDEETPRRFLVNGEDGGLVLTNAAPWYLNAASARKPKEDDAMILRETGSPGGLYSSAQAPLRPAVEHLLPHEAHHAAGIKGIATAAIRREMERFRRDNPGVEVPLALYNQPCRQGSKCCNRNRASPTDRCKYVHRHTHDDPLLYKLNYETGEWSDTDFKKALDSGVMRDSVSGELVSILPRTRPGPLVITFANGNTKTRYLKQLRVPARSTPATRAELKTTLETLGVDFKSSDSTKYLQRKLEENWPGEDD